MADEGEQKNLPATVEFDQLPPLAQVERFSTNTANYLETVERRIEQSNLQGVAAVVAKYQAIERLSIQTTTLRSNFATEMISGTGLISPEHLQQAVEGGLEGANAY